MIQRISKKKVVVFWQEPKDIVGEPTILLTNYSDVLEIQQSKKTILISLDVIEEFIKAIRQSIKKEAT